jgi:hypothetical protein
MASNIFKITAIPEQNCQKGLLKPRVEEKVPAGNRNVK